MPTSSNIKAAVGFCLLACGVQAKADTPLSEVQAGAAPAQTGKAIPRLPIWGVRPAGAAPLNPPSPPGSPWAAFEEQQRERERALAALPRPTPDDAKRLLKLLANQKVCRVYVDLKTQNETLEQVAARVQRLLPQPAPPIEVRGALPIRLSFALKHSTVGDVLMSAGNLAGVKLWVLDDKLLLAPDAALSKDEQGRSGSWSQSGRWQEPPSVSGNEVGRVFITLLSEDLLAHFAVASEVAPNPNQLPWGKLPPAKTTFAMLSPQSQEWLRQLVEQDNHSLDSKFHMALSPDTVVGINASSSSGIELGSLDIEGGDGLSRDWALNGMSRGARAAGRTGASPSGGGNGATFLDPSAGKS